MKRVISALCLLVCVATALAKDKPKITVQVVDTQNSTRQITYYIPGSNGHSTTNCTGNATAIDVGGGMTTANGTTNCETTTTPATPPSTGAINIAQVHVHAIMPDGMHVTLWCQAAWRHCRMSAAGYYQAEVEGNSVWLLGHDLSGKENKTKYHYVGGW